MGDPKDPSQEELLEAFKRIIARELGKNLASKNLRITPQQIRYFAGSLKDMLPAEDKASFAEAIAASKNYAHDPRVELTVLTRTIRDAFPHLKKEELKDSLSLWRSVLIFEPLHGNTKFKASLEEEARKPLPIPDVPDVPQTADTTTPAERLKALNTLLSKELAANLALFDENPEIKPDDSKHPVMPRDLRMAGRNLAQRLLDSDNFNVLDEKMAATRSYMLNPREEVAALSNILRRWVDDYISKHPDISAEKSLELQMLMQETFPKTMSRESSFDKKIYAEVKHPSPLPGLPEVTANPEVPPLLHMQAVNAAFARLLADNLNAPEDKRKLSLLDIHNFLESAQPAVADEERAAYREMLQKITPDKLQSNPEGMAVISRFAREFMEKQLVNNPMHSHKLALNMENCINNNFKNCLGTDRCFFDDVRRELQNPSAVPPFPDIPVEAKILMLPKPLPIPNVEEGIKEIWDGSQAGVYDAKEGVWKITYTFKPPTYPGSNLAKKLRPMSEAKQKAAQEVMREASTIGNIVFIEATAENVAKANIILGEGDWSDEKDRTFSWKKKNAEGKEEEEKYVCTWSGYANTHGDSRVLILWSGEPENIYTLEPIRKRGYHTMAHEFMHLLGFRHPGANAADGPYAGGFNPHFNTFITNLSYNEKALMPGFSPLDCKGIQDKYGAAKKPGTKVFDLADLRHMATLSGTQPITITLANSMEKPALSGNIVANLSTDHFEEQLRLNLFETEHPANLLTLDPRIDFGTPVKFVLVDNAMPVDAYITGSYNSHIKAGGGAYNTLTLRGGDNTAIGGSGHNTFVLDARSGNANMIAGFHPKDDAILIGGGVKEVQLLEIKTLDKEGKKLEGTMLDLMADTKAEPIASVFVENILPEKLKPHVKALPTMEGVAKIALPHEVMAAVAQLRKDAKSQGVAMEKPLAEIVENLAPPVFSAAPPVPDKTPEKTNKR